MNTSVPDRALTRSDRILLTVFAAIAAVFGLVTLIGGALRIRLYLLAAVDATPVSLLTETAVDVGRSDSGPQVITGIYPTADLLARGLSDATRVLLGVGEGLAVLVSAVVSLSLAVLFVLVARGRPFARPLSGLTLAAGATLAIGSLAAQAIGGFGRMNAAVELNEVAGDLFRVGFSFDPAPLVIGFAIMALAYVFRAGTRLQRDTEGLV